MNLGWTLSQIIEVVGGKTSLDHSFLVEKIASLSSAGPRDLAIVFDRGDASVFDAVSQEAIKQSTAGIILATHVLVEGKNFLIVNDPLRAYQKLIEHIKLAALERSERIHPTALIAATAQVNESAFIGAGSVVESDAHIGAGTTLGSHVYVGKGCTLGSHVMLYPGVKILDGCILGDGVIVHSNTVIGSDGFGYQVTLRGMQKIPHIGIVRVGNEVEIGANVSIDRAVFDETVIGNGVKIDNNVHIAHGVHVGDHTAILALTGIAGSARIGKGCQIGGQVGIKDHVTIGNGVKIVAQSAVLKDLPDGVTVAGSPAMPFGEWKRIMVGLTKVPEIFKKASLLENYLNQQKASKPWWQRLFGK